MEVDSLERKITQGEDELSDDYKEAIKNYLGIGTSANSGQNVHTFLHNVVLARDTTKLGVLTEEELGQLENPLRAFKFISLFSKSIMDEPELSTFFNDEGEIITATSLSRKGTLLNLAVVQRREMADITKKEPTAKQKKNWFTKKDKEETVLDS